MNKYSWNIVELMSHFTEDRREFDIGDNVAIFYKDDLLPIKINGVVREELKVVKASFCIYDVYDEGYTPYDYNLEVEILVLEEYSDSPYSIYIDSKGNLDTYEYEDIATIEVGNILVLKVENNVVTHYQMKEI